MMNISNKPPERDNTVSLADKFKEMTCRRCNLRIDSYIWGDRWEQASTLWLNPRAKFVFDLIYGLNGRNLHSYHEIGKILHVTRERVRQIEYGHGKDFHTLVDMMNEKYKTGFHSQPIDLIKPWVTEAVFKAIKEMGIVDINAFMHYWPNKIDFFEDKKGIGSVYLNRIKNMLTIFYL